MQWTVGLLLCQHPMSPGVVPCVCRMGIKVLRMKSAVLLPPYQQVTQVKDTAARTKGLAPIDPLKSTKHMMPVVL